MATSAHIREYSFRIRIRSPFLGPHCQVGSSESVLSTSHLIRYQWYPIRMSGAISKSYTRPLLQPPSRRLRTPILWLGLSDQACQARAAHGAHSWRAHVHHAPARHGRLESLFRKTTCANSEPILGVVSLCWEFSFDIGSY
jgi:hypothetical protein